MAWILDLDGVVWLGEQPISGSVEAIAKLRAAGERVVFVTNNSSLTRDQYVAKLEGMRIAARTDEVVTSAMAAARLLTAGSSALVLGGDGVREALVERGVDLSMPGAACDAVVVGWHRDFGFDSLTAGIRAILAGARFLATNDDPTYPAPDGVLPGCGSIVAFVATATGQRPEVAGKPNPPMVTLVREQLGDELPRSVLVGDRASTDGALARALGVRFALVRTGIDAVHDAGEVSPDIAVADLAALVDVLGNAP